MKKMSKRYEKEIIYIIFGVATTAVNWMVYSLGVAVLGYSIMCSNIAAWVISVLFAYVTNKIWVFKSEITNIKGIAKELILFLGARIISGIFEIVMLPVLMKCGLEQKVFGIDGMLAKVIVSVVIVVLNYIFSKNIIFKKS